MKTRQCWTASKRDGHLQARATALVAFPGICRLEQIESVFYNTGVNDEDPLKAAAGALIVRRILGRHGLTHKRSLDELRLHSTSSQGYPFDHQ